MSTDGIPGDLNGDNKVNNKDAILLFRHLSGWNVEVDNDALDVTGDGKVDQDDGMTLFRYVAGWPNIVLHRGTQGGNSIYKITYYLCSDASSYLVNQEIENNSLEYYTQSGYTLGRATADGYIFDGWYDGEGTQAERITKIPAGTTGDIELYAHWTPRPYKVDFDSDRVVVPSKTYTIETGATIPSPKYENYIFVGWTDDNGKWVKSIPKGKTGNVVLHDNWSSKRNVAVPVKSLDKPIVIEDEDNGVILFVYELGRIENVPLSTTLQFGSAGGVSTTVTHRNEKKISTGNAATIRNAVSSATANSTTWTLSEGWNNTTTVSEETLKQTGLTREQAETLSKTSSNTYMVDTSKGGTEVIQNESGYSFRSQGNQTHMNSGTTMNGVKSSYDVDTGSQTTEEIGAEVGIHLENESGVEAGAEGSAPGKKVTGKLTDKVTTGLDTKISGKFSATQSIDAHSGTETSQSKSDTTSDSWSSTIDTAANNSHATTNTKSWNTNESYSASNSCSNSRTTSEILSEVIANKYGYGQSYSKNGSHSSGQSFSFQDSAVNEYSTTVTYDSTELDVEEISYSTNGVADGYYRVVQAGTAHVFGVAGYDIAKRVYFTYTYTVMDDETHAFLDYSKDSPSFSDNQISVLPFNVPSFVNDYVNTRIMRSDGLEVDISTGRITNYTGNDGIVVIPSYWRVSNGDDTYSSIKITGFDSGAFRNNKSVMGIVLSDFITEIPDSAFEGCTALRDIYAPSLTSIGKRAFYGCTSLSKLTVPTNVTSIGEKAFYNVNEVAINAASKDVATAATQCGAKAITLNISTLDSKMDNSTLTVSNGVESFELQGGRKNFQNLSVESDALTTTINGVNFKECKRIPMKISSETVNLNQVTADASGFCMILSGSKADISLFGTITLKSASDNAVVLKNATFTKSSPSTGGKINATGNVLLCGSMTGDNLLTFNKGRVVS